MAKAYMYILECSDGSYYTGSTKNLELRLQQHQNGEGANHTKKHLPVKLVYWEEYSRIDDAFYREKQVQGWSRKKKEALINGHFQELPELSMAYRDNEPSTIQEREPSRPSGSGERTRPSGSGKSEVAEALEATNNGPLSTQKKEPSSTSGSGKGTRHSDSRKSGVAEALDSGNNDNSDSMKSGPSRTSGPESTKVAEALEATVPKLRFKEFEGEWEERKLADIAKFQKGKGISKSDISVDGSLECIRYGELYTTYTELIQEIVSKTNLPAKDLILSEFNDVIIPASGESNIDIATASCVLKSGVAFSGDLNIIRSKMNGIFLSFYLNNKRKLDIARLAQGVSVVHLYSSQLKTLILNLPSLREQQKIASFLSAVDEKIQLLTKKKEALEQYKKGVMQQLFSQKIRFTPSLEDFKDELAQGMVIDLAANYPEWNWVGGNKLFDNISDKNHNSDLPILAITQDQGAIPREMIDYQMTVTEKSISSYKVVQVGDFVISLRTFQGGIEYSNYHGICSPAYIILRPNSDDVDRTFYKFYLKTSYYIKQLQKNLEGIRDGKMISYKYFSEIKLPFPSLSEQQKISNFLLAIDAKIEGVNQQIEKTQTFKKGLLQQMFV